MLRLSDDITILLIRVHKVKGGMPAEQASTSGARPQPRLPTSPKSQGVKRNRCPDFTRTLGTEIKEINLRHLPRARAGQPV